MYFGGANQSTDDDSYGPPLWLILLILAVATTITILELTGITDWLPNPTSTPSKPKPPPSPVNVEKIDGSNSIKNQDYEFSATLTGEPTNGLVLWFGDAGYLWEDLFPSVSVRDRKAQLTVFKVDPHASDTEFMTARREVSIPNGGLRLKVMRKGNTMTILGNGLTIYTGQINTEDVPNVKPTDKIVYRLPGKAINNINLKLK